MKVTSGSNDKTALFNSADYSSSKSLSREDIALTDTRSVESVDGDGESDIDDVPDISEEVIVVRKKRWIETVDVAAVIQGHQYRNLSLLLGPMACCFWVAM